MNYRVFIKVLALFLFVFFASILFESLPHLFFQASYVGGNIFTHVFFCFFSLFFVFVVFDFFFSRSLVFSSSILFGFFSLFYRSIYLTSLPIDFHVIFIIYYQVFSVLLYIVFCYCRACSVGLVFVLVYFVFIFKGFGGDPLENKPSVDKHCFKEGELFLRLELFAKREGFNYYVERDSFCIVFVGLSEEQEVHIGRIVDETIYELYVK